MPRKQKRRARMDSTYIPHAMQEFARALLKTDLTPEAMRGLMLFYQQSGTYTADDGYWFFFAPTNRGDNDAGPYRTEKHARKAFRALLESIRGKPYKRYEWSITQ